MNPTQEQINKFRKHHLPEEPIQESKWLKTMSKDEIRNGYEQVQRELKEIEK